MMYTLKVENEQGDQLELTHSNDYTVINVEGLGPPKANINTAVVASFDGSRFNSSRMTERNLVLTIVIENEIERNRLNLYQYFKPKKPCKLYYRNATREVFIDGYVETFEISLFDNRQMAQISVICPDPFFQALRERIVDFRSVTSMFRFPFATPTAGIPFAQQEMDMSKVIVNGGDVESGVLVTLHATGPVSNPILYNVDTRESMGLSLTMQDGDTVTINTNKGQKRILLNRDGVTTNIINRLVRGSSWFQISSGENTFTYTVANDLVANLNVIFQHTDKYEGV